MQQIKRQHLQKEKELDKKAKNMAHTLEDGIKSAGESLENLFKN